jgi:hypothetical protein
MADRSNNSIVEKLLDSIFQASETNSSASASSRSLLERRANLARELPMAELPRFLAGIHEQSSRLSEAIAQRAMESVASILVERSGFTDSFGPNEVKLVGSLHELTPPSSDLRSIWLAWLAQIATPDSLRKWNLLMEQNPPKTDLGIVRAVSPVAKNGNLPDEFYEQLLTGAFQHPKLAPITLDLTNYHVRMKLRDQHPAHTKVSALTELLNETVNQLERIESGSIASEYSPERLREIANDSLALVYSLCDTLALCQHRDAEGPLRRASRLRHRRIQTEAASALARLGFDEGRTRLVQLAAEPVVRLRVLAYAEELNILDEIDEAQRDDLAIAEAKLANWLSEQSQFGVAPSEIQLIDQRELYWPSYEHPVLCHLFRFRYGKGPQAFQNLGLVGPIVHAFPTDIRWLGMDDIYAAFAGWQAEHPEIYELNIEQALKYHPQIVRQRNSALKDREYQQIEPILLGHLLGDWILVASAINEASEGFAMTDGKSVHWFGNNEQQPVNASFAYMIYRGRRMLQSFNQEMS